MAYSVEPQLDPIVRGMDARVHLSAQDSADANRDWTGATVSVKFYTTHPTDAGATFTKSGALSGTPTAPPQAYVDIVPADTSSLAAPQNLLAVVTVTLSGGKKDRARFVLPMRED